MFMNLFFLIFVSGAFVSFFLYRKFKDYNFLAVFFACVVVCVLQISYFMAISLEEKLKHDYPEEYSYYLIEINKKQVILINPKFLDNGFIETEEIIIKPKTVLKKVSRSFAVALLVSQ